MGTPALRTVVVLVAMVVVVACGGGLTAVTPTASHPAPTVSTRNPGGALAGFLHAAALQENSQVLRWLATTTDSTNLHELLTVYSGFGAGNGFFWEVKGVSPTGERSVDATHAQVALTGPIVWCLGAAPNDPAATCSAVNGVAGLQNTYAAVAVAGEWKADVDVNASSGLDHNPRASPTATGTPAVP
jgi:hypothetical protein